MNREQRRKAAKKKGKGDRGIQGNNLLADILSYALSLHQGGQLAEAESVYKQMLKSQPQNSQVLNHRPEGGKGEIS